MIGMKEVHYKFTNDIRISETCGDEANLNYT